MLFFFLFFVLSVVSAASTADKKPLVLHGKQRQWTGDELEEHHRQMRKVHKDYIPVYPDALVLTVLSIGTPAVDYSVSLESGSEALFVLAKDYPGRLANQTFFDPAQSSTAEYAGDYHAFSGDLEVFGAAYDDVIGLFDFGPEFNTTQRFGVVNGVYEPVSLSPPMPGGVLGLSWNPADAANPNENSSAILNLFREFPDRERYWCQRLDDVSDEHGRAYSVLTEFGGCLPAFCQEATAANTFPLEWQEETRSLAFHIDQFTYKGKEYSGGSEKVDTGVPHILMPWDGYLAVSADADPTYDWQLGLYTVDCSKAGSLPDWVFTIGGKQFAVPSSAYVVDLLLSDGQCALSIAMSDAVETTDFVLGNVFSKLWCIKMDVEKQAISILDVVPQATKKERTN